MFFPEGQIRVHLYGYPTDMRKSFTGLYALTREGLCLDPLSGDLFVFISRRATQMRVLYFDRSGFCVWAKRLDAGRFISNWSQVRTREMDWTALKLLLEGIEPGRLRKRFRYTAPAQKRAPFSSHAIDSAHAEPRPEELTEPRPDRAHEQR
jgi:transposase